MKQQPKHVLEFFCHDSWWVRLLALLVDRLSAPQIWLAVISLIGSMFFWKSFS